MTQSVGVHLPAFSSAVGFTSHRISECQKKDKSSQFQARSHELQRKRLPPSPHPYICIEF